MHHLFQDQFWKELLAQYYRLKGNIFSRECTSSNQASWHMTTVRLMLHFVVTEHSKEAMTGDLNDFFIHFRAEPGHVEASKELQFCTCTVHFRSIYFSCMLWRQQCASVPKISKWKYSPVEAYIQRHVPCGTGLSEEQIAHNVKLHHSRNRKPLRDSPEWQGNNEVFRSIKTFTEELKDLLISVCTTENAGKYWPQMYFFRLKS